MDRHDYRDMIGGTALVFAGIFVAVYATTQLQVGTLSRMGPGMFPAALGVLLCVFGAIIVIQGMRRPGTLPSIEARPLIFVLASILVFGLTIRRFGIAPAVVTSTLVAVQADRRLSWRGAIFLSAGLAVLAVLIFNIGLDIPIEPVRWLGR